jgi:hypothetical protein
MRFSVTMQYAVRVWWMMSRNNSMQQKAYAYDKVGVTKHDVNSALTVLKELRVKYPFTENLRSIEWLEPDKLFKVSPDEVGEFFRLLENSLKPLSQSIANSSNVYRNTRLQIAEFKNLLRIAVDNRRSLAQKVDASWERIGGIAQDKVLAKQIIFCFNYEKGAVLPIFSTQHLRHFVNRVVDEPSGQTKFYSLGEEYEHYMVELVKTKNSLPPTQTWDPIYFTCFLYASYPPPDSEKPTANPSGEGKTINVVTNEQLELRAFVKLLGELQAKGKITGEQFRENRELWMHQQPNDRDVQVWRLKKLLTEEPKPSPKAPDEIPKKPTRQKL